MSKDAVTTERELRMGMWSDLKRAGGPYSVAPDLVRELGIYGGSQGIWVDKERTSALTTDGVGIAVGLLHTGFSYADDLSDTGVIYHYPKTHRPPARDRAEVDATKRALTLELPLFVITHSANDATKRDVHLAWVVGWDDDVEWFDIIFADESPVSILAKAPEPFHLDETRPTKKRETQVRPGQTHFKFRVVKLYGPSCAVCGNSIKDVLDAAHIKPIKDSGSDHPQNGIVLCANHHRMYDANLFCIEPATFAIRYPRDGRGGAELGIVYDSISHLENKPHEMALEWRWRKWSQGR